MGGGLPAAWMSLNLTGRAFHPRQCGTAHRYGDLRICGNGTLLSCRACPLESR